MEELKVTNSGVIIKPSQMDIYETTELPEDEQNGQIIFGDSSQNDCVEPIGVSIQQAFHHFQGKTLEANEADFSDDISRIRYSGYSANTFALGTDVGQASETLEQRCQRLQQELRELAKEVELMKENANLDPSSSSLALSPLDLINQTEYLKRQMVDLTAEKQSGGAGGVSSSATALSDPQGALQRRLLAELNGFQFKPTSTSKSQATPKATPATTSDSSDHVNYQLFYRPEQAKFCNNARIADYEQRIERLEAVLGQSPEKLSLLTSEMSNKNLMSAVCLLLAKTKVLDPVQLDLLEPRLASVYHKVSRTTADKKKEFASDDQAERLATVSQLMDLVAKVDILSGNLPTIVDRLCTLGQLHEQAVEVSETLLNLDVSQRQMNEHLSGDATMLKQFEEVLVRSAAITESNARSLNDRVKAVTNK